MKNLNKTGEIFLKSIELYLLNIHKFFMYMSFPVLGQILGLVLIIIPALFMRTALPELTAKYSVLADDPVKQFGLVLLTTMPGLILMISAFWKYLVAYVALNSMTQSALTSGKVYDFPAHNSIVTRNLGNYIILWCFISIFGLLMFNPILGILGGILFIFFILVFQVFTFENDKNVFSVLGRSFKLVQKDFFGTMWMSLVFGIGTYILAELAKWGLCKIYDCTKFLPQIAQIIHETDKINGINSMFIQLGFAQYQITTGMISEVLFGSLVAFLVFGYTLPHRSIFWTLWYKKLTGGEKKVSAKSPKGKKQLDPEIIRRANLRDDEEV